MDRNAAIAMIMEGVYSIAPAALDGGDVELDESTTLFGHQGILDSLGLVSLIVEVEQMVADAYDVAITIGDDRAMSQKHSPFRTVGVLADYVVMLMQEVEHSDVPE